MNGLEKAKEVFAVIISGATVFVALADIWSKISPEVKKIVGPFIEDCRKLSNNYTSSNVPAIG